MYEVIVRFKDGSVESKTFDRIDAAEVYMHDTSMLEKREILRIAIVDDKNTVEAIMPFDKGKSMPVIREGSLVKIRSEFCVGNERRYMYVAKNLNDSMGACDISQIESKLILGSLERVSVKAIEPVGDTTVFNMLR